MATEYYFHFLTADRRLRHGDGREVIVGETLAMPEAGSPKPCMRGMHGSRNIMDALGYAPGPVLTVVTLGGEIVHEGDKSVGRTRTCLWMLDCDRLLREFACDVAEMALMREREAGREPDPRSWAVIEVMRRWLRVKASESEPDAARDAARDAANAVWAAVCAASAAARDAAWAASAAAMDDAASAASAAWAASAASAAAGDVWAAAGDVWDAASAAARDAASAAAWDAARDAARTAARDAASAAAWDAAWDAARDAARASFGEHLLGLLLKAGMPAEYACAE